MIFPVITLFTLFSGGERQRIISESVGPVNSHLPGNYQIKNPHHCVHQTVFLIEIKVRALLGH